MEPEGSDAELSTLGRSDPGPQPAAAFVLTAIAGPDQGVSLAIDGARPSRVLIGQSPACELRLTDREASRRHVALEVVGGKLRITDLGSKNGTYVERLSIGEANLDGGETIRIGTNLFRVDRKDVVHRAELPVAASFGRVIGGSREMRQLYTQCTRLAALDLPIIIEGESGTGKEMLAESLHEMSPRAGGPFIVFDCTDASTNLSEVDLFGDELGRAGAFERAHGGTIFIDEIDDLAPSLQSKLVRAIERSEVRRMGADRWVKVDVRVLVATRDFALDVQRARFRDDLFHRLGIARLELPPLRKREGDISLLARHFAAGFGAAADDLPDELLARWEEQPWPGNVRQLRNAVARALALGKSLAVEVDPEDLEGNAARSSTAPTENVFESVLAEGLPLIQARQKIVDEFQRCYVKRVLAAHDGNVMRAAAASGIARRYFQILRARQAR